MLTLNGEFQGCFTKYCLISGQESPGWISLYRFVIFFVVENLQGYQKVNIFNFKTVILLSFWKWKYYFFYLPSNPPLIVVWNSLTNQFYQKICIFSTKKWWVFPGPFSTFQFCIHFFYFFLNIQKPQFLV